MESCRACSTHAAHLISCRKAVQHALDYELPMFPGSVAHQVVAILLPARHSHTGMCKAAQPVQGGSGAASKP